MENIKDASLLKEPEEERQYNFREKLLRDFFINEYLVDYDQVAAAVRVGYGKQYAQEMSVCFMNEPYVVRKIKEREQTTTEADPEVVRNRILAGLYREANYNGPGSSQAARVAALSKLASLYGMDPAIRSQQELLHKQQMVDGSGTIIVPGLMTEEQWEEAASKQQEALIAGNPTAKPAAVIH
jgi:phage terminase small subunit